MEHRPHPADAIATFYKARTLKEKVATLKLMDPRHIEHWCWWRLEKYGFTQSFNIIRDAISNHRRRAGEPYISATLRHTWYALSELCLGKLLLRCSLAY